MLRNLTIDFNRQRFHIETAYPGTEGWILAVYVKEKRYPIYLTCNHFSAGSKNGERISFQINAKIVGTPYRIREYEFAQTSPYFNEIYNIAVPVTDYRVNFIEGKFHHVDKTEFAERLFEVTSEITTVRLPSATGNPFVFRILHGDNIPRRCTLNFRKRSAS